MTTPLPSDLARDARAILSELPVAYVQVHTFSGQLPAERVLRMVRSVHDQVAETFDEPRESRVGLQTACDDLTRWSDVWTWHPSAPYWTQRLRTALDDAQVTCGASPWERVPERVCPLCLRDGHLERNSDTGAHRCRVSRAEWGTGRLPQCGALCTCTSTGERSMSEPEWNDGDRVRLVSETAEVPYTLHGQLGNVVVCELESGARLRCLPHELEPATAKPMQLDANDPFESVIIDMVNTNRAKRRDYAVDGSPFSNFDDTSNALGIEGFGATESAIFNVNQKIARLRSLRKNGRMDDPSNESVTDTYLDLAVYACIALAIHKYPNGDVNHE